MKKISRLLLLFCVVPLSIIFYYQISGATLKFEYLIICSAITIALLVSIIYPKLIIHALVFLLVITYIATILTWGSIVPFSSLLPILISPFIYILYEKKYVYFFQFLVLFLLGLEFIEILPFQKDPYWVVGAENILLIGLISISIFMTQNYLLKLAFLDTHTDNKISLLVIRGLYSSLSAHTNKNLLNSFIWQKDSKQKEALIKLLGNSPVDSNNTIRGTSIKEILAILTKYFGDILDIKISFDSYKKNINSSHLLILPLILFDLLSNISQHGDVTAPVRISCQRDVITLRNALLPGATCREPRSLSLAARYLEKTNLGLLTWKVENGEWVVRVEIY